MSDSAVSPHNLEAERAVLGAVLISDDAIVSAEAIIRPADFFRDAHRRIFHAMVSLSARRDAIDFVTLKAELQRAGELEDVGGPVYIASLVDGVPRSTNVEHYARIVKTTAHARTIIAYAREAVDTFTADPAAIGNGLGSRFADAVRREIDAAHIGSDAGAPFSESIPSLIARAEDLGREMLIDDLLALGEIGLVHGDPRAKKTLILLTICATVAVGGCLFGLPQLRASKPRRVLYLTGEDSTRRTLARAIDIVHGLGVDELPEAFRLRCVDNLLDDPAYQRRLIDEVRAEGIELVVAEPLRSMSAAVDQGPRELQPLARYFRRLIGETGVALGLGAHNTKPQAGVTDTRRKAQRVSGGGLFSIAEAPMHAESLDEQTVLLTPDAFKHQDTPPPIVLRFEHGDGWMRLTGEVSTASAAETVGLHGKILEFLAHSPGKSGSAVAGGLHARKDHVLDALQALSAGDKVDSVREGRAVRWFLKGGQA